LTPNGLYKEKGLPQEWFEKIKTLEKRCNEYDGITLKTHDEMLEKRSAEEVNDFLWFVEGEVVGACSLFQFVGEEIEVLAMVDPAHRRQGIMTRLQEAAEVEGRKRGAQRLLYICSDNAVAGKGYLEQQGLAVAFSEYGMSWTGKTQAGGKPQTVNSQGENRHVELRVADASDRETLIAVDREGFRESYENAASYVDLVLGNMPEDRPYLAEMVDPQTGARTLVGKICVNGRDGVAYIYAFSVAAAYRGQGYGRFILQEIIDLLVSEKWSSIQLEVQVDNDKALGLYQQCGFQQTNILRYFAKPL
jgi:ribosomal protein S18 acetylase RimI-like enzyme